MAAGYSVGPDQWYAEADRLLGRMARRFVPVETRDGSREFVLGLLADLGCDGQQPVDRPDFDERQVRRWTVAAQDLAAMIATRCSW